jgi:hypothetical protein
MLWKGISRFVSMRPHYRWLFGPVSISRDYQNISRRLMAAFLKENNGVTDLSRLIRSRNPLLIKSLKKRDIKSAIGLLPDVQGLSELISEIETDNKGVPILIKQYLRLGGKILGFNVDKNFSDVLDALILVDLTQTDRRILDRYFGREKAQNFLMFHNKQPAENYG